MFTNTNNSISISQISSCCGSPHGQAMYSEKKEVVFSLTSLEGKVSLIGISLACVHFLGLCLSLYYLVATYLSHDLPDDPTTHLCTDAIVCILFRHGPQIHHTGHTNTALAGQLLFSLLALLVNALLVCSALSAKPLGILVWLACYLLDILGCLVLVAIIAATLTHRYHYYGDIMEEELGWIAVPSLLCIVYLTCWIIVCMLYIRIRRQQTTRFYATQ